MDRWINDFTALRNPQMNRAFLGLLMQCNPYRYKRVSNYEMWRINSARNGHGVLEYFYFSKYLNTLMCYARFEYEKTRYNLSYFYVDPSITEAELLISRLFYDFDVVGFSHRLKNNMLVNRIFIGCLRLGMQYLDTGSGLSINDNYNSSFTSCIKNITKLVVINKKETDDES